MNGFIFVSVSEASRMRKMKEGLNTTDSALALSCLMIASALPGAEFWEPGLGQQPQQGTAKEC